MCPILDGYGVMAVF